MDEVKISIVTATYNRPDKLKHMIESILTQRYDNFELIVVDDCSSEENNLLNQKICGVDERIKYIHLLENKKQCNARNIGVKCSTGDWIRYLDDDDELYPNSLHLYNRYIQENPDIKVFTTRYKINNSVEGVDISKLDHPLDNWQIDTCCVIHKRECFDIAGGWNVNLKVCDDYEFIMRYYFYFKEEYKFIDEVCAVFNYDETSSYLFGLQDDYFEAFKIMADVFGKFCQVRKTVIVTDKNFDLRKYLYGMHSFFTVDVCSVLKDNSYDDVYICHNGELLREFFKMEYCFFNKIIKKNQDIIVRR